MSDVTFFIFVGVAVVVGLLLRRRAQKKVTRPVAAEPAVPQAQQCNATTGGALTRIKSLMRERGFLYGVFAGAGAVVLMTTVIFTKWSLLAPYLIAPLVGVFSYFFSRRDRGYKKLLHSAVTAGFVTLAITFWIHPEVFRTMFEPYIGGESFFRLTHNGGYRVYVFIGVLFILSLFTGYVIEGVIGMGLLIFLWCL